MIEFFYLFVKNFYLTLAIVSKDFFLFKIKIFGLII